jgi:hypothetical protein
MSESFAPLAPATTGTNKAAFNSIQLKGLASRTAQSIPAAPKMAGSEPEACSKPLVTLQRNGDTVSGIRIECGCGQVVDLACVY